MSELETAVEQTDRELFDAAVAGRLDDPGEPARVEGEGDGASAVVEQPRAPNGQFAAPPPTEASTPAPAPAPSEAAPAPAEPQTPAESPTAMVPSFRLREEAEARRQANEQLQQFAAQNRMLMELLQKAQTGQQPVAQPQAPKEQIDPVAALMADPEAFLAERLKAEREAVRQEILKEFQPDLTLASQQREFYSRREAERQHGADKVSAAYSALQAEINAGRLDGKTVVAQLGRSMDPYGEILDWHQKQQRVDPTEYGQQLRTDLLKDPEFLRQALEAARGLAALNGNTIAQPGGVPSAPAPQRPAAPPSLPSLANIGAASVQPETEDVSDAELFNRTTTQHRRGRRR